mgnify:CR=1 FL=1
MKNKINKFIHSKYLLISLIVLLILLVIATGTYAWFTWRSTSNTSLTMNIGKLTDVTFNSGNDISTSTLAPVYNYTDGEKTTFSINNKDTTGASLDYNIKLNITSIASELKSSDLKYVLLKDNTIVKEGNFSTMVVGANSIYSNSISSSGTTNFIFYLYIDGNSENNLNMMNKSLVGTITVEATDKESFTTYITNLYESATKTTVTNNSITYQYDTTNSLMKDIGNNIRYYGASPNNYIYFNCSDYSNQSSSTCETWRIIGVFNDNVKIIRNESIGAYSWDNKQKNYTWETASLMKLLNPGYESETVGGSLYYNSGNGTCYSGLNYATTTCNFTSSGLKDNFTKNVIAEHDWNIGPTNQMYVNAEYENEVKNKFKAYVGLPNVSDYGYATNLKLCTSKVSSYSNSECKDNNWMFYMATGSKKMAYFINYAVNSALNNWAINALTEGGNVDIFDNDINDTLPTTSSDIFPTLYFSNLVSIAGGTGTSSNPYQLQVS